MRRIAPILIIFIGSIITLAGGGMSLFNNAVRNPRPAPLPSQVANVLMTIKSEGWMATSEFNRLHRQEFPMISGSVGTYGVDKEAKLWVAEAPIEFIARKMVADMHNKIAEGNSPFTPKDIRTHSDHTVHELDGMGQKHFYFQSGRFIVWLAANDEIAEQALESTLEFYR